MHKNFIATSLVIASLLFGSIGFSQSSQAAVPLAEFGSNKVKLEVAQTSEQIQHGLMYRQTMPEDEGMVFLFRPTRPVRFWMYHCYMSLDMIFIKDGKISKIARNVPPCKSPEPGDCPLYPEDGEVEASEVVEVNAGYCKRHEIKEGDSVKFTFPGFPSLPSAKNASPGSAGSLPASSDISDNAKSEKAPAANPPDTKSGAEKPAAEKSGEKNGK